MNKNFLLLILLITWKLNVKTVKEYYFLLYHCIIQWLNNCVTTVKNIWQKIITRVWHERAAADRVSERLIMETISINFIALLDIICYIIHIWKYMYEHTHESVRIPPWNLLFKPTIYWASYWDSQDYGLFQTHLNICDVMRSLLSILIVI